MTLIGAEQDLIDRWVDGRLKANTDFNTINAGLAGRVFNMFAPTGTTYPFIIYQAQSPPRDVRGVGTARVMVDSLYIVKAVAQASTFNALSAIAAEIDQVMTVATGENITTPAGNGLLLASVRDDQFSLVELEQGKQYRHLGGLYRIHAQAA